MKVSFNTKEFDKRIMEVLSQFPEASKTAMQRATLVVEGEAKEQCPVDLGTLRSSITSKVNKESNGVAGYVYTNEEQKIKTVGQLLGSLKPVKVSGLLLKDKSLARF